MRFGGEPVVGETERCAEICRTGMGYAIDAGLHRVAPPGAEPLRQAPIDAAPGQRKAENAVGRDVIVHAGGIAISAGGNVVRTRGGITACLIAAAEGGGPGGPALREALRRRRLEHA